MCFVVKDLCFKIRSSEILKKQNFSLEKSKHLMISGPSGSGKTTLMNLMSGLLRPTSGSIIFKGYDFSKLDDEKIDNIRSKYFGFIFQRLHLIKHLTVEQNIILGLNKNQTVNFDELLEEIGLTTKKNQLAKYLSFGESQRVAIARGVINNPKIIFADEPTSSLDDKNAKKVLELIFSQAKKNNSTIILSSHDYRIKTIVKNLSEIRL
tara:strand:- start:422 stop:1045 length:624 start_codon:yes stop_codon:yes gene_type:complete